MYKTMEEFPNGWNREAVPHSASAVDIATADRRELPSPLSNRFNRFNSIMRSDCTAAVLCVCVCACECVCVCVCVCR
jgi:hypothetical protein